MDNSKVKPNKPKTEDKEKKPRGRPKKEVKPEEANLSKHQKYKNYQQNYQKKYYTEHKGEYIDKAKERRKKIKGALKLLKEQGISLKDIKVE